VRLAPHAASIVAPTHCNPTLYNPLLLFLLVLVV